MMSPKTRFWLAAGTLAVLGGCVNLGAGKAPPQLYTLSPATHAPAGTQFTARVADTLVVEEPETDRSLATARMAVQISPTAIAYMKDAFWVERPARLLRNLLAEDLRAGGKRMVQLDEDGAGGGTRLGGRLLAIGYDGHAHAAVIRYDATLSGGKDGTILRRFEVSEPGVAPNGSDVAQALNTAANTLAGQVAQWVDENRPVTAPVTAGPAPQTAPRP